MARNLTIEVGPLKENELPEAERILRLAFGRFLGLPDPMAAMGDRDFMTSRWRSAHVKAIAARENGRLIGSNLATRWGSFGFFGPLTVAPEYWDRGVAQRLLEATMKTFDRWGVTHSGLFTFAHSPKHVAIYEKFGYWPRYLTLLMTRAAEPAQGETAGAPALLSQLTRSGREEAIEACRNIAGGIYQGLDLTGEIRAALRQRTGDTVLTYTRGALDGFAVCLTGPRSEGGEKLCYIKFGAARRGAGAAGRFDRLLAGCEAFAASREVSVEAGVNMGREGAYRAMRSRGYRSKMQGIAMQRPNDEAFNRPDVYAVDDWR